MQLLTIFSIFLNVGLASLAKMIKKLDENLTWHLKNIGDVCSTEVEINITKNMYEKHSLLVDFLKMIGVDNEVAHLEDAKWIEHHIHP